MPFAVIDFETTGLVPERTDRVVEIGVALTDDSGRIEHEWTTLVNPHRDIGATHVHGIQACDVVDAPDFAAISDHLLEMLTGRVVVAHNASFDMRFINAELEWAGQPGLPSDRALDTLAIARKKFPGSPASLDALCRRFGIDNSMREKHGALLDSEILAEVYLELTGGKQPDFALAPVAARTDRGSAEEEWRPHPRRDALPSRITEEEKAAHAAFVSELGDGAVWKRYS